MVDLETDVPQLPLIRVEFGDIIFVRLYRIDMGSCAVGIITSTNINESQL